MRVKIWAEHSDLVGGDRKWRVVRKKAKSIMHFWYYATVCDADVLEGDEEGFPGRFLFYDNEDVVLQQTWSISSMRVLEIYPRRQTIDIVFQR